MDNNENIKINLQENKDDNINTDNDIIDLVVNDLNKNSSEFTRNIFYI